MSLIIFVNNKKMKLFSELNFKYGYINIKEKKVVIVEENESTQSNKVEQYIEEIAASLGVNYLVYKDLESEYIFWGKDIGYRGLYNQKEPSLQNYDEHLTNIITAYVKEF